MSGVPFHKDITLAGLNGLRGAEVTAFSLAGSNATAALVEMTVAIPNPSVAGIAPLGDIGCGE